MFTVSRDKISRSRVWTGVMIRIVLCFLFLGVVSTQNVTVCEDVDTNACRLLVSAKPDYCADESLSTPTCAKFCGHCPKVCYHCDDVVMDASECNTTKVCAKNEICMIKQLRSTVDGHHEYHLSCADQQACDGPGLTFAFGFGKRAIKSRDVSVHCCKDDLCNYPEQMTTSPPPVTVATGCSRDIIFMIDTSQRSAWGAHAHGHDAHASSALHESLQLVHDVVSQLHIGPYDNLVALSTFDRSVNKQWDLKDHLSKNELLQAISNVHGRVHFTAHGDIEEALKFLFKHIMDQHNGDRPQFPDDVIIITDTASSFHNPLLKQQLQSMSRDVIVISVDQATTSSGQTSDLATDDAHKLSVSSYGNLPSIGGQLFNLLCT